MKNLKHSALLFSLLASQTGLCAAADCPRSNRAEFDPAIEKYVRFLEEPFYA